MKLGRRIADRRLGSSLARMARVKATAPVGEQYLTQESPAPVPVPREARDGLPVAAYARGLLQAGGGALCRGARAYYARHRAVVHLAGAALLLATLAGWARHRRTT